MSHRHCPGHPVPTPASIADQVLNSSILAARLERPKTITDPHSGRTVSYTGDISAGTAVPVRDGKLYYQGREVKPDVNAGSAIIYVRPTRNHWWQFWRPKQATIDWRGVFK